VIAATHRDLKKLIAAGQFREDLYHRLDLYRIGIPPLRERGDDVLKLAELLMERLSRRHRLPCKTMTAAGRAKLLAHPWPGNVRELSHELERGVVFEDGDQLEFAHLALPGGEGATLDPHDWLNAKFAFPAQGFSLEDAINRLIQLALKQTNHNVSAAARLLGVSRDYVRYRLSGGKMPGSPGE
jgi:DNA-binding NtrC family response regulator